MEEENKICVHCKYFQYVQYEPTKGICTKIGGRQNFDNQCNKFEQSETHRRKIKNETEKNHLQNNNG